MRTWAQSDSSDARAGMGAAAGTPTSSTAQLGEITCTAPMGALRLSPSCRVSAANMCPDTMTCRVGVRRARHNELEETGHTRRTRAATQNKVLQRHTRRLSCGSHIVVNPAPPRIRRDNLGNE